MLPPLRFLFHHQTLWLSAGRCIFWEEERALILSDLHFGKSGHFRKSGIGIPQSIYKEDLQKLFSQIQFFKPEMVLVVGDMFHSTANKELAFFLKWRHDIPEVAFCLIRGNHDILSEKFYKEAGIQLYENNLAIGSFCFTHDVTSAYSTEDEKVFTFSGHLHPGIKMKGLGSQTLVLPCFYFAKNYAVLPAFSAFTGVATISPAKTDEVFVIVENRVMKIQ